MAEKVTTMVVKVDLDCYKCRKKIKKVLCCIPQIQNQVYDEKANTVTITVVCCSPEKIQKKILQKGGKTVKGIDIKAPKEPEKPKAPDEKPKDAEKSKAPDQKPKDPEKPKAPPEKPKAAPEKPKDPEKPKAPPEKPKEPQKPEAAPKKPEGGEKPKVVASEAPKADQASIYLPPLVAQLAPEPVPGYPQGMMMGYMDYGYEGLATGGYVRQPPPAYGGYGRPVYDSWGGGDGGGYRGPCSVMNRSHYYLSEENPTGCIIM